MKTFTTRPAPRMLNSLPSVLRVLASPGLVFLRVAPYRLTMGSRFRRQVTVGGV